MIAVALSSPLALTVAPTPPRPLWSVEHARPARPHPTTGPRTILGNFQMWSNPDTFNFENSHMFLLLFLCFLPRFHVICVQIHEVIYYNTLSEHVICVLKDLTM
jgi:hypothetical protein